eukprot:14620318-Alexandrium_andersonii.AAC.1
MINLLYQQVPSGQLRRKLPERAGSRGTQQEAASFRLPRRRACIVGALAADRLRRRCARCQRDTIR